MARKAAAWSRMLSLLTATSSRRSPRSSTLSMFSLIVFFTASTFWRTASTLERLLNCSTASCNGKAAASADDKTATVQDAAKGTRPQHGAGARQRIGGQRVELRAVALR